ncbi:hypothetical protein, partial [uncultured Dysosmobacter sp.]|uniref:hypothetical protein n=1 Tax=uncultured Dysosmobacter sp. TaxID=2591384 RepID=UPI002637EE9E
MTPILFSRGGVPGAGDCVLLSFICIVLSVYERTGGKRTRLFQPRLFAGAAPLHPAGFLKKARAKTLLFQFAGGQLGQVGVEEAVQVAVHDPVDVAGSTPRAGDVRGPRISLKWPGRARPFQGFAAQNAW